MSRKKNADFTKQLETINEIVIEKTVIKPKIILREVKKVADPEKKIKKENPEEKINKHVKEVEERLEKKEIELKKSYEKREAELKKNYERKETLLKKDSERRLAEI